MQSELGSRSDLGLQDEEQEDLRPVQPINSSLRWTVLTLNLVSLAYNLEHGIIPAALPEIRKHYKTTSFSEAMIQCSSVIGTQLGVTFATAARLSLQKFPLAASVLVIGISGVATRFLSLDNGLPMMLFFWRFVSGVASAYVVNLMPRWINIVHTHDSSKKHAETQKYGIVGTIIGYLLALLCTLNSWDLSQLPWALLSGVPSEQSDVDGLRGLDASGVSSRWSDENAQSELFARDPKMTLWSLIVGPSDFRRAFLWSGFFSLGLSVMIIVWVSSKDLTLSDYTEIENIESAHKVKGFLGPDIQLLDIRASSRGKSHKQQKSNRRSPGRDGSNKRFPNKSLDRSRTDALLRPQNVLPNTFTSHESLVFEALTHFAPLNVYQRLSKESLSLTNLSKESMSCQLDNEDPCPYNRNEDSLNENGFDGDRKKERIPCPYSSQEELGVIEEKNQSIEIDNSEEALSGCVYDDQCITVACPGFQIGQIGRTNERTIEEPDEQTQSGDKNERFCSDEMSQERERHVFSSEEIFPPLCLVWMPIASNAQRMCSSFVFRVKGRRLSALDDLVKLFGHPEFLGMTLSVWINTTAAQAVSFWLFTTYTVAMEVSTSRALLGISLVFVAGTFIGLDLAGRLEPFVRKEERKAGGISVPLELITCLGVLGTLATLCGLGSFFVEDFWPTTLMFTLAVIFGAAAIPMTSSAIGLATPRELHETAYGFHQFAFQSTWFCGPLLPVLVSWIYGRRAEDFGIRIMVLLPCFGLIFLTIAWLHRRSVLENVESDDFETELMPLKDQERHRLLSDG